LVVGFWRLDRFQVVGVLAAFYEVVEHLLGPKALLTTTYGGDDGVACEGP
jgi:hypothetical protein